MNRNSDTGIVPALHRTPLFAAGGRIRVAARFPMGHYRGTTRGRRKGRNDSLSRRSTRLRRLHTQIQVLSDMLARKIARSDHEAARDKARAIAKTEPTPFHVAHEKKRSRCSSLI
jgi:hypothetical protein